MLPVLLFILGAPSFVQADTAVAPVDPDHGFSDMVKIPAGRFRMGLSFKQVSRILKICTKVDKACTLWWFKDEMPRHGVYVDKYWIDIYEVTNQNYLKFVKATGHRPALDNTCETKACRQGNLWKGKGFPRKIRNQPVTQVNWYDAVAYCKWRGKRLPTEAEWEKAARGPSGNMYPWGNSAPPGKATYRRKWRGVSTMTEVGSYPNGVSVYGIHDMAGNVWEWVADWYDMYYYKEKIKNNPKGAESGKYKVVRGGSWVNYADTLHSAFRRWSRPKVRFNDTGFRCAKDPIHETQTN
jgi:formylglycine-generating enzyme required for sulfatase activity